MLSLTGDAHLLHPLFNESGGHRWQRIPPTEKKDRVQTSTVTVAVYEPGVDTAWVIPDKDIQVFTTKDTGPGGQHRNTTESCVVMRHLPTGIEAKSAAKSQHDNRRNARRMLEARVQHWYARQRADQRQAGIREQRGSGMRGDKIRTYQVKNNVVIDHRRNCKFVLDRFMSGMFLA